MEPKNEFCVSYYKSLFEVLFMPVAERMEDEFHPEFERQYKQ